MRMKALAITSGAVLAAALMPGLASADPGHHGAGAPTSGAPSAAPAVAPQPLARGSLGEFRVRDRATGLRMTVDGPTDLALVKATLPPGGETGWHGHTGPSFVIVESGTMTYVQPRHGGRGGCTEETFAKGAAFPHSSGAHNFVNESEKDAVVFYVAYFVPEAAAPAPVATVRPRGC